MLIQKWIIADTNNRFYRGGKGGEIMTWSTDPSLARIYSNYSDAAMAIKYIVEECQPIELRFHFNEKTLPIRKNSSTISVDVTNFSFDGYEFGEKEKYDYPVGEYKSQPDYTNFDQ